MMLSNKNVEFKTKFRLKIQKKRQAPNKILIRTRFSIMQASKHVTFCLFSFKCCSL